MTEVTCKLEGCQPFAWQLEAQMTTTNGRRRSSDSRKALRKLRLRGATTIAGHNLTLAPSIRSFGEAASVVA